MKEKEFLCSVVGHNKGLARLKIERNGNDCILISQWLAHPLSGVFESESPYVYFEISRRQAPEVLIGAVHCKAAGDKYTFEDECIDIETGKRLLVCVECLSDESLFCLVEISVLRVCPDSGELKKIRSILLPEGDVFRFAYAVLECWSDNGQQITANG